MNVMQDPMPIICKYFYRICVLGGVEIWSLQCSFCGTRNTWISFENWIRARVINFKIRVLSIDQKLHRYDQISGWRRLSSLRQLLSPGDHSWWDCKNMSNNEFCDISVFCKIYFFLQNKLYIWNLQITCFKMIIICLHSNSLIFFHLFKN